VAATYDPGMIGRAPAPSFVADTARAALAWLAGWWRTLYLGALVLVMALSPSSYQRDNRHALARHIVLDTAPVLLWFTLLSSLVSLVVIRIVVTTALTYGLSQYALEMLVRVLVLELIPLTAALFVALRCTIPNGAELARMRFRGEFDALRSQGIDPIGRELMPRVLAGFVAVLMLAAVSCAVALVLSYLGVYGFTRGGLAGYGRVVGQIFNPAVALVFSLKTLFLGLAVALIPMTAGAYGVLVKGMRTRADLQGLVRLFVVVLLIEAVSLMGNYY